MREQVQAEAGELVLVALAAVSRWTQLVLRADCWRRSLRAESAGAAQRQGEERCTPDLSAFQGIRNVCGAELLFSYPCELYVYTCLHPPVQANLHFAHHCQSEAPCLLLGKAESVLYTLFTTLHHFLAVTSGCLDCQCSNLWCP